MAASSLLAHGSVPGDSIWSVQHIDLALLPVLLAAAYILAIVIRSDAPNTPPWEQAVTRGQVLCFATGILFIAAALTGPVETLSGSLYVFHMTQHMILTFAAPPLLLLGTPAWMLRALLRPRWLVAVTGPRRSYRVAWWLTRPVPALLLFNVALMVNHWPKVVELMLQNDMFHAAVHISLFSTATLMWFPVVSPLMELPRLSYPGQMFYLFMQSVVPTVPASFLTFARNPIYPIYESVTPLWGLSALQDQQMAGLLMKIGGGLFLWAIITVLFIRWYNAEQREGVDMLKWRDVERQLNRVKVDS